jgi:hypothetical protein
MYRGGAVFPRLPPHDVWHRVQLRLRLEAVMDALAERLDTKLREWKPATAAQVRQQVTEIIELADQDVLDILRSRIVEQEVLDILEEPTAR